MAAKTSVIAAYLGDASAPERDPLLVIVLNDGPRFELAALAEGVVKIWDSFFQKHGSDEPSRLTIACSWRSFQHKGTLDRVHPESRRS